MLNNQFSETFLRERLPEIREELLEEVNEDIIRRYNSYVQSQDIVKSVKSYAVFKHQYVQFGSY